MPKNESGAHREEPFSKEVQTFCKYIYGMISDAGLLDTGNSDLNVFNR